MSDQKTAEALGLKFAPRDVFEVILEYAVIPTFDLVIEMPDRSGVVMARRIIKPYENLWALPGLRIYKPEEIDDVLTRVARQEVGLDIDIASKRLLGQYVGKFETERQRQDISTAYVVKATSSTVTLNRDHFSSYQLVQGLAGVPQATGAMYRYYLTKYFGQAPQHRP